MLLIFLIKQKTAYEMRSSDWSSDVCSSDLLHYRASAAYGLAIWLSTLGTDGYQSRAISLALAQRYAAAFVELDTVSALAQLGVCAAATHLRLGCCACAAKIPRPAQARSNEWPVSPSPASPTNKSEKQR